MPDVGHQAGQRFKALRDALGLSREVFAKPLGVKATMIQDVERGRQNPSIGLLAAIQDIYRPNPDWLLNGTGAMFLASGGVAEPTPEWVDRAREIARPRGLAAATLPRSGRNEIRRYEAASSVVEEVLRATGVDVDPLMREALRMVACDGAKPEHLLMLAKALQQDRRK